MIPGLKSHWLWLCCLLFIICPVEAATSDEQTIPRTVIALYNTAAGNDSFWSPAHQLAEMPLNHLGLRLKYHNIEKGLPSVHDDPTVRGVLSWFHSGTEIKDPLAYLQWAEKIVMAGKKFVILGGPGFWSDKYQTDTLLFAINRFMRLLGVRFGDQWVDYTYDLKISSKNPEMVEFERRYGLVYPPFQKTTLIREQAQSYLIVHKSRKIGSRSHLVVTNKNGGYVADDYALFRKQQLGQEQKQWYINPFKFFSVAFDTHKLPKPDVTTLAGRRIYYSHIDGDGWNNLTEIPEYRKNPIHSSQVILEKSIRPYPDLPVTVAPVAAELDLSWSGSRRSLEIARSIFKESHVEMGSHSYSHPFDWDYFISEKSHQESKLLTRYPEGGWQKENLLTRFVSAIRRKKKEIYAFNEAGPQRNAYEIPRAYASQPFDLDLEINGAAAFLNRIAPKGKKVEIIMWSGNTLPFENAIRVSRLAGLYNLNGGDSRFDKEYPSYAWVCPVGRTLGDEHQIYASNSNENTYTDLWSGKYHGFRHLIETVKNTESPLRIKPFNIYYHMYSGEKLASLNALLENLKYARRQPLTPVKSSHYAAIAQGFFTTEFQRNGKGCWEVMNRGALQTIRFDDHGTDSVDLFRSNGIVGQRYFQNSLYVYLDQKADRPRICLKSSKTAKKPLDPDRIHLVQSRWPVWDLRFNRKGFRFSSQGFGKTEMTWKAAAGRPYVLEVSSSGGTKKRSRGVTTPTGLLTIDLQLPVTHPSVFAVHFQGRK